MPPRGFENYIGIHQGVPVFRKDNFIVTVDGNIIGECNETFELKTNRKRVVLKF